MLFNFFDKSTVKECLCSHFSIAQHLFEDEIRRFDCVHDSPCDFAKKLGIDLLTSTDNCCIVCRHITTANDNLSSIMSKGMLTLDRMLSDNTPMSLFLKKCGIEVYPEKRSMRIKDKVVEINGFDEPCNPCFRNPDNTVDKRLTYHCCEFNQEMALLNNKLYHDKSEVEAFISGSDEELLDYQSVLNGPEILWTIGKIIHSVYQKTSESFLQDQWSKQKGMKRYILEFTVPLNAIDTNTDRKTRNTYDDYKDWLDYSEFDISDYFNGIIPLTLFRNKKLIEVGLDVLFDSARDIYCQILPEHHISPSEIKTHREYTI